MKEIKFSISVKALYIALAICVGVAVVGGLGYYWGQSAKGDTVVQGTAESANSAESNKADVKEVVKPVEPAPNSVEGVIKRFGITADVAAQSDMGDDGFLLLANNQGAQVIYIYDAVLDYVAMASPGNRDYSTITAFGKTSQYSAGRYEPAIFTLWLNNWDQSTPDGRLGEWNGDTQLVPIYISYDVESNGKYRIPSIYSSASGLNPMKYHSRVTDQRTISILNTLMNHINSLRDNAAQKGII